MATQEPSTKDTKPDLSKSTEAKSAAEAGLGKLQEVTPGHFEITVESDIHREREAEAARIAKKFHGSTGWSEETQSTDAESRAKLHNLNQLTAAEIDSVLESLPTTEAQSASIDKRKIFSADALADTLRASETPEIQVVSEFPDLPNKSLAEEILALGIEAETVKKIDKYLKENLGGTYNEGMTANQVPSIVWVFKELATPLRAGMDPRFIDATILKDLRNRIPRRSATQSSREHRSPSELQLDALSALPESWRTPEKIKYLQENNYVNAIVSLHEAMGSGNTIQLLEALPSAVTTDNLAMSRLLSNQSANRLVSIFNRYKSTQPILDTIEKLAPLIKREPEIISELFRSEAFPAINDLLSRLSLVEVAKSKDALIAHVKGIVDKNTNVDYSPLASLEDAQPKTLRELVSEKEFEAKGSVDSILGNYKQPSAPADIDEQVFSTFKKRAGQEPERQDMSESGEYPVTLKDLLNEDDTNLASTDANDIGNLDTLRG